MRKTHISNPKRSKDDQQNSIVDLSSSVSTSASQQKTHYQGTHKRDPNRANYASNQCSIKKPELNTPNSQLGSKTTSLESPKSKTESFFDSEVGSLIDDASCLGLSERIENKEENSDVGLDKKEESEEKKDVVVDVISVLNELQLGVMEPELSEEQLRINDQTQEDELLVMESIYGENIVILDGQNGLRCFQINLQVGDARELTITAKLNAEDSNLEVSPDEFSYSFKVQYLPPVTLTCLLPKSYPSHLPPCFTLSVKWLDNVRISSLCSMLDSLWTEQSGQEIIYHWTEWLQNFSLSHLGVDDEITLGPYGMKYNRGKRAVSGSVSMDSDVPFLKSYNDEQCYDNFRQNMHECPICYSEFIQCPDTKCKGMVPPYLLKQLLDEKEYERWESLTLQKSLESMSDVLYCPRCETPCLADGDRHAQCSKCLFSFCTVCGQKRHVGEECLTPELRLRLLEERQNSSVLKGNQFRKVQDMINEMLNVTAIRSDSKQCPSCKMAISRSGGCNKMICTNCGQYFCYRCNSAIKGYEHFKESKCDLFPGERTVEQLQQRTRNRPLLLQNGIPVLCPSCGNQNTKVYNNNHILCWACQHHFCYLCKQMVKRSSQHYGPKGCKQHTEG